jgi:hypothetical protein
LKKVDEVAMKRATTTQTDWRNTKSRANTCSFLSEYKHTAPVVSALD